LKNHTNQPIYVADNADNLNYQLYRRNKFVLSGMLNLLLLNGLDKGIDSPNPMLILLS
jgi:hypothetical protein